MRTISDPYFCVKTLEATHRPQSLIWAAMHQDYSESFVAYEDRPEETQAGKVAVKRLLRGERGHYGPLEHPSITLNVGYFPHSVMQQARTHRVGISFDVQSMRYTGERIVKAAQGQLDFDQVFYLRPVGTYSSRDGGRYDYTHKMREVEKAAVLRTAQLYAKRVEAGAPFEHARGLLSFDYRQHFVVSFNLRSLLHFLDLRFKADAQLEIITLCEHILPILKQWTPEIAEWYISNRLQRARLAP